jgi:hypothetical protein
MRKTFKSFCKEINEASMLPNPANLKKPGIGPGSGQHSVGNMNVRSKSLSQAVADTGTYQAQSALNAPKLDMSKKVNTSNVKTPIVNNAVAQKTAADKAKAVATASKSPGAPAGGNYAGAVKPHTSNAGFGPVATNAQLTGAAIARKGFGAPAGGNYPSAQKVNPQKAPNAADNVKDNKPANNAQLTAQANARKGFGKDAGGGNYPSAQTPSSGAQASAPPKPTPRPQQPTGNPNVKTSGTPVVPGNANIKPSATPNFKQAYAAARKAGQTNFEWGGKKFNTNMKGETAAKRTQVLNRNAQRTAGQKARTGGLSEMVKNVMREARTPVYSGGAQGKAKLGGAGLKQRVGGQVSRGNQNITGRHLSETEKEIQKAKTGDEKKKRTETLNLEPQQSDEKIF